MAPAPAARPGRRRTLAVVALALGLAPLAGCGGDGGSAPPSSTPSSSPSPSPSGGGAAADVPAFTLDVPEDAPSCFALGKDESAEVAWHAGTLNVSADATITRVYATDSPQVDLAARDSVTLRPVVEGEVEPLLDISRWPLSQSDLGRYARLDAAEDLRDRPLRSGQVVVPVLHFTVSRGGSAGGLVVEYALANGRTGSASYDLGLEFPRRCPKGEGG